MEIRDYKPGDEKAILDLFKVSYGKSMSPDYWKWRFANNPLKKVMIQLMWDQDKLVGHYAVSPVMLRINGERILTALSMTTMTHPDYNGRGIFTSLAETLYKKEAERSGLQAVWGFPNNNSHYGFVKNLKWIDLEQIPVFSINTANIKRVKQNSVSVITEFSEKHIETSSSLLDDFGAGTERSLAYLKWRYLDNPSHKYVVFGSGAGNNLFYAVTKIFPSFSSPGQYEIDLLELSFPNDSETLTNLLNAILECYSDKSPVRLNAWVPLKSINHIQLEKIGFTNGGPVTYAGIRILGNEPLVSEAFRSWYYSMGDSDIY